MAEFYGPFTAGVGANVTDAQWRRMAREFAPSGVLASQTFSSDLSIAGQTGNAVIIQAGAAWVDGHLYELDANTTVPLTDNPSGSPRKALVVLRLNPTAQTITLVPLYGTPSSNPQLPTWQNNPGGLFDLPLGHVTQPPTGQAQTPYAHTDYRPLSRWPLLVAGGSWTHDNGGTRPLQVAAGSGVYLTNSFGQFSLDLPFKSLLGLNIMTADTEAFGGHFGIYSPGVTAQGFQRPVIRCYRGAVASGTVYVKISFIAVGAA